MPVFGTRAVPDKAMTLDLAALQSTSSATAAPPPATKTFRTPVSKPTAAAPAPAPADTDFAEPENSWASSEPGRPAFSAPVAQSAAAPVMTSGSAVPMPQNPWVQIAASRTAIYPAVPSEMAQYVPSKPSAPAGAQSAAAAAHSDPAAASSAPAQRQCFTNSEGIKICYMDDEQSRNTTDVHKEGGVNDYHNQASASEKQAIQGHVPGNNVTATLNNLGYNPPPNEHKHGNTVFQGENEVDINTQHDIHKDNVTYTEHGSFNANGDSAWKSAHKGPDGSKEMAEINKDYQGQGEKDTKVDANGKDKVNTSERKGSDDRKFLSDRPATKDDSSLVWDEDWTQRQQKEEFQGKGVYDLHEETSTEKKVQAKVDGDQGWKQFEQNMDDFDVFFDGDEAWKEKMKDPRFQASATVEGGVAAPTASYVALKRDVAAGLAKSGDKLALMAPAAEGETFTVQKRENPWKLAWEDWKDQREGWKEDEQEKKAKEASGWDKRDVSDEALAAIVEIGHGIEKADTKLVARENPWKLAWEDWKDQREAWKEDEQIKKQQKKEKEEEERQKYGGGRRSIGESGDDGHAITVSDFKDTDSFITLDAIDAITNIDRLEARTSDPFALAASALEENTAAKEDATAENKMDNALFIFSLCLIVLLILGLASILWVKVKGCLQRRKERLNRQAYMREIEGVHVVDVPPVMRD